jgi:hypothetical protein
MNEFDELRYPFATLSEFVSGGYFAERAGLHLTIALIVFAILTMQVMVGRGSVLQRLITVFFAGTVYNNPAFAVPGGLHLNEIAGVVASFWIGVLLLGGLRMHLRGVGIPLLIGGLVMLVHAAFVSVLDITVVPDNSTAIVRVVLLARIFVLAIIALGIEALYTTTDDFETLMNAMVRFGVAAIAIYFLQTGIFLSGTRPYGTYWDAGFTGIPSFGAVSIERGHFGKFLVMLFPFFAWAAMKQRRWVPLGLFLLVTLVNFSASSMSFLVGYIVITVLVLHRYLLRPAAVKWLLPVGVMVVLLASRFGEQYGGLIQKVLQVGLKGDAEGGRGFSVLEAYLAAHPFGLGYSGSTLRNVGTLPMINMGAYAMASQLSLLLIPIFVGFLWLTYRVVRESRYIDDPLLAGVLIAGMLMAILMDLVDVLWFVPTIWAPMLVCNGLANIRRGSEIDHAIEIRPFTSNLVAGDR